MAAHLPTTFERTNRTRCKADHLVVPTRSSRRPAEAQVCCNFIEDPERATAAIRTTSGLRTALTGRLMAWAGTAPRIIRWSLREAALVMHLLPVQDSA